MSKKKIGVWLIGALGSISSTVILGALAMRRGMTGDTGMVTAMDPFRNLGMPAVENMEFGGCDIRRLSLRDAAQEALKASGNTDISFSSELEDDIKRVEDAVSVGIASNCGEAIEKMMVENGYCDLSIRDQIARIADLIQAFKVSKEVDQVIVVNVASTEPPIGLQECHRDLSLFERGLDQNRTEIIRASAVYSYAAIQAGCPYINFTPSTAALAPAIVQFAELNGVPVMGNDGKTGETLVKSVLAPMFMLRNLKILSWEGFNILGNMDGRVLDNPQNKESKIQTKDGSYPEFSVLAAFRGPHQLRSVPGRPKDCLGLYPFQGLSGRQNVPAVYLARLRFLPRCAADSGSRAVGGSLEKCRRKGSHVTPCMLFQESAGM